MITKNYLKTTPLCKVTFSLPKNAIEGANEVRILGDFNNWDWEKGVPMKAGKETLSAEIGLESGNVYEFRYRGDNQVWENDWQADKYVASPFTGVENSVVEIPFQLTVIETPVKPTKRTATKKATAKRTATKKTTTAKAKTTTKKATAKKTTAKKDNLKTIEGIGPKIAGLLNAEGIITFADLSKAKQATLKKVLADAGSRYKMHDPTTWPTQAKLAAAGKTEELKKLQEKLKGGRAKK